MSWKEEVEELRRRQEMALALGGPEGIARQRQRGKLTVRERIEVLADSGSFREFRGLVGSATYEGNRLAAFTPKGSVEGTVRVDGRKVVVNAGDFTVRGGSASSAFRGAIGQEPTAVERALAALRRFKAITNQLGVKNLRAIATAACRDAQDFLM